MVASSEMGGRREGTIRSGHASWRAAYSHWKSPWERWTSIYGAGKAGRLVYRGIKGLKVGVNQHSKEGLK